MDGRKYLALVLLVCGMMDVAVAMGGIRFPRKNIISLTDLKNVSCIHYRYSNMLMLYADF